MSDYFHYQDNRLHAEQAPLADIAAQFGTPCYVYSRAALTDGFRQFADALRGREHLVCYAVKANSNLAILNVFARLGAGFDIVSGGELQRIRYIKLPASPAVPLPATRSKPFIRVCPTYSLKHWSARMT